MSLFVETITQCDKGRRSVKTISITAFEWMDG